MSKRLQVGPNEVERAVLPTSLTVGYTSYYLYAVHPEKGVAFLKVSYNHSTRPEFGTGVAHWGQPAEDATYAHGHPRKNGVTTKDGWALTKEHKEGGDW